MSYSKRSIDNPSLVLIGTDGLNPLTISGLEPLLLAVESWACLRSMPYPCVVGVDEHMYQTVFNNRKHLPYEENERFILTAMDIYTQLESLLLAFDMRSVYHATMSMLDKQTIKLEIFHTGV